MGMVILVNIDINKLLLQCNCSDIRKQRQVSVLCVQVKRHWYWTQWIEKCCL